MRTLYFGHWSITLIQDGIPIDKLYYPVSDKGPIESSKTKDLAIRWTKEPIVDGSDLENVPYGC